MQQTLSQKIRTALDYPLRKKPVVFLILLPLLFLFSFIIALEAKRRRKKSYAPSKTNNNLKIICVGNILIGGSGKSPIVQKIAQEFLENDYLVAIAARGITEHQKNLFITPENQSEESLKLLSDENKEHFELLKTKNLIKNLYIFQNKNRNESLCYFIDHINKKYPSQKAVFILDDGLQHFACPRNINFCVWSPHLLLNSPNFSMPVGPYREGFGENSFRTLLESFDYRLWSRAPTENINEFKENIKKALKKYNISLSKKDFIISYNLECVSFDPYKKAFTVIKQDKIVEISTVGVLTGIAKPDIFLKDCQKFFSRATNWNTLFLDDHASFYKFKNEIISFIRNQKICIFTFKDYCRWKDEPEFQKEIWDKQVYICYLNLEVVDVLSFPRKRESTLLSLA